MWRIGASMFGARRKEAADTPLPAWVQALLLEKYVCWSRFACIDPPPHRPSTSVATTLPSSPQSHVVCSTFRSRLFVMHEQSVSSPSRTDESDDDVSIVEVSQAMTAATLTPPRAAVPRLQLAGTKLPVLPPPAASSGKAPRECQACCCSSSRSCSVSRRLPRGSEARAQPVADDGWGKDRARRATAIAAHARKFAHRAHQGSSERTRPDRPDEGRRVPRAVHSHSDVHRPRESRRQPRSSGSV
jgi:hypothetical protein